MNIYDNEDEMGENGISKQISYKAEQVFRRSIPHLVRGGDPAYGTVVATSLVIHLGLGENEPVKLPISALVKCKTEDDVVALIETQYAIQKLQ